MSLVKSPPNEIRYDPNHAIATSIFRILAKEWKTMPSKDNPRPPRLRYWEHIVKSDNTSIRFKGLMLLDVFDLHVLLALVAIAIAKPAHVSGGSTTEIGKFLHNSLDKERPPVDATEDDDPRQLMLDILDHMPTQSLPVAAVARCSSWELTQLVTGSDNNLSYKRIKESLFRLLHTTVTVTNANGDKFTSNMVSSVYESKDKGKKKIMSVAVNPVLTSALQLGTGKRYIKLYLDTFAGLSQVGQWLYTYLSARTWDAKPHEYTTEALVALVHPALPLDRPDDKPKPISRTGALKRTKTVVEAMKALNRLEGWTVDEKVSAKNLQKWVVTRQKTLNT